MCIVCRARCVFVLVCRLRGRLLGPAAGPIGRCCLARLLVLLVQRPWRVKSKKKRRRGSSDAQGQRAQMPSGRPVTLVLPSGHVPAGTGEGLEEKRRHAMCMWGERLEPKNNSSDARKHTNIARIQDQKHHTDNCHAPASRTLQSHRRTGIKQTDGGHGDTDRLREGKNGRPLAPASDDSTCATAREPRAAWPR